jgi:ubiquinone biosynthesis UbiH/UbiF/VisC/COQ6 family hydroxylase
MLRRFRTDFREIKMDYDIIVIGAGPSGATFVSGLADAGLRIAMIDQQKRETLVDPAYDGRDIALSQRTVDILKQCGIWQQIPDTEVSPIRAARVVNGKSPYSLDFDAKAGGERPLGRLVSNHIIRKAAMATALNIKGVDLLDGETVEDVAPGEDRSSVRLADGSVLTAPLVIAADTRFSPARRQAGISASMHDFGQVMIVARMDHSIDHDGVSWECFFYGSTLAVLPLNGSVSSIVLTLPHQEAQRWLGKSPEAYADAITRRLGGILGNMKLVSARTSYPLVGVYANRFAGDGFALIGDAAVGMHPVTAHGYNFCVAGAQALSRRVNKAARAGEDIRSKTLLRAYEAEHRLRTWPLYASTQKLVQLYTSEVPPAKILRKIVLRAGNVFTPAKSVITGMLTRHAA